MKNGKRWTGVLWGIGIGWYIGLSIILPTLGGRWLDRRLDTNILFSFIGLGVGIIIAFVGVYYLIGPSLRR
ncbi:MAG: AtpZ/AtpI family protein [Chloroflexota bacterium]